jgi:HAD superfamily hydrolase (TIGR01457 family)
VLGKSAVLSVILSEAKDLLWFTAQRDPAHGMGCSLGEPPRAQDDGKGTDSLGEVDYARLGACRHFLLDMDGTIYLGKNLIPGAAEFVQFLRDSGRSLLFLTNNSSASAEQYAGKLAGMGIDATSDDVFTSGEATVRYLLERTEYRRVFALGTPSFEAELTQAGLTLTDEDPEAVVLAFDRTLDYAKLETACLLLREGLPYVATNPDKVCPTDYGYIPDCGSMAALLATATGRTPTVIGKPSAIMIEMALGKICGTPDTTAMVGDRLYTDMRMARDGGITGVLVLSGEATRSDVDVSEIQPEYVLESVREIQAALGG